MSLHEPPERAGSSRREITIFDRVLQAHALGAKASIRVGGGLSGAGIPALPGVVVGRSGRRSGSGVAPDPYRVQEPVRMGPAGGWQPGAR